MIYNKLFIEYNKIEYDYLDYRKSKTLKNIYKYMKSLIRFHFLFLKYKKSIYNMNEISIDNIKEFISFIFSFTNKDTIDISIGKLQCIVGASSYYSLLFSDAETKISLLIHFKEQCIVKYTKGDYTINTYFNDTLIIDKDNTSNFNITGVIFKLLQDIFYYSIDGLFNYIGGYYSDKSNDIQKYRGRAL